MIDSLAGRARGGAHGQVSIAPYATGDLAPVAPLSYSEPMNLAATPEMERLRPLGWIDAVALACTFWLAASASPQALWAKGNTIDRSRKARKQNHPMKVLPYTAKTYPDHGIADVVTPQGRRVRGFYLTPYYLKAVGARRAARVMKSAHMNAVVLDIKDDWGQVLWPSKVPLAQKVMFPQFIKDPAQTIKTFHQAGIYVIARLVAFKDSSLPFVRPDLSVRFKPGRRLYWAQEGWLDAYSQEVRDYIIDLAREWESYGVDEIQLDYIRFPKGRTSTYGVWLHKGSESRSRAQLIADFLDRLDRAIKVPLSVDVFGLTTLVDGDPRRLGQTIEKMAKHAEVISPMMYPEGMRSYFRNNIVTPRAYSIIHCGMWRARQKVPQVVLRPFLQAYSNEIPFYGKEFIVKQIGAAERGGSDGFLFWNSSMKNSVAYQALRGMGKKRLAAFGSKPEQWRDHRPRRWCKAPGSGNVFESPAPATARKGKRRRKNPRLNAAAQPQAPAAQAASDEGATTAPKTAASSAR